MRINGVDFNIEWAAARSKEEFVSHPALLEHWPELRSEEEKKLRLGECWEILRGEFKNKNSIVELEATTVKEEENKSEAAE